MRTRPCDLRSGTRAYQAKRASPTTRTCKTPKDCPSRRHRRAGRLANRRRIPYPCFPLETRLARVLLPSFPPAARLLRLPLAGSPCAHGCDSDVVPMDGQYHRPRRGPRQPRAREGGHHVGVPRPSPPCWDTPCAVRTNRNSLKTTRAGRHRGNRRVPCGGDGPNARWPFFAACAEGTQPHWLRKPRDQLTAEELYSESLQIAQGA